MTISLKSKASGKPNLDLVFDPYVEGTNPADTGLLIDGPLGGTDISQSRYAPIIYGTAAPATGLLTKQSGHADINTLFAAYGTAVYLYSVTLTPGSRNAFVEVNFSLPTITSWLLENGSDDMGGSQTASANFATANGSIASGVTEALATLTYLAAPGDTNTAIVTNPYPLWSTAMTGSSNSVALQLAAPLGAVHQATYNMRIQLRNASAVVIYDRTFKIYMHSTG